VQKIDISNTLSPIVSQARCDENALISTRVAAASIPFALQSVSNSDSYQVNSTSSNIMSSDFISSSSFTVFTFQFSSKWCESFTRM